MSDSTGTGLTAEEFLALPIVQKALYLDPGDARCGFMLDQSGVSWIIGFDGGTLCRAGRDGCFSVPNMPAPENPNPSSP